jgi:hypothetical protein
MGACACAAGYTQCTSGCVNTMSDPHNCGGCGIACTSSQVCTNGACAASSGCIPPTTLCGSACVNTTNNNLNCGACGSVCQGLPPPSNPCQVLAGTAFCSGSVCNNSTSYVNQPAGTACGSGLVCDGNGTCGTACVGGGSGAACVVDADCCSPRTCRSNVCSP